MDFIPRPCCTSMYFFTTEVYTSRLAMSFGQTSSRLSRAAKRPVVLVVPVLELHAVDVAAVE